MSLKAMPFDHVSVYFNSTDDDLSCDNCQSLAGGEMEFAQCGIFDFSFFARIEFYVAHHSWSAVDELFRRNSWLSFSLNLFL